MGFWFYDWRRNGVKWVLSKECELWLWSVSALFIWRVW